MKVIAVRQPWAWLIIHANKDIENRTWATRYRGKLLIQASASMPTRRALEEARLFAERRGVALPEEFELGGVVGMVQLTDCVDWSESKWFQGPIGWGSWWVHAEARSDETPSDLTVMEFRIDGWVTILRWACSCRC